MSMTRLPEGKVPWGLISDHVRATLPPDVLLGPAQGEDAALVRMGDETWAVATDPISFTAEGAGRLAVIVNANDVAVRGAQPRFFVAVLLIAPDQASAENVSTLLTQIRTSCERLGVTLIGGHTEVTPGLSHSLVVGTMLGRVTDRAITTGGLREGDWIGMTKWAGLEGTSILLAEFGGRLGTHCGKPAVRSMEEIYAGEWLEVVSEATIAASIPAVSALHDVTEGGVGEALYELGQASGLSLDVRVDDIPVLPETRRICEDLQMNPFGLIGSGALLVGCGDAGRRKLESAYAKRGIPFTWLGRAVVQETDKQSAIPRFERDEILKAHLLDRVDAFVFDLDGTLIDSEYDWPSVRRQLSVRQGSIIDTLNGLASPAREERWNTLRNIEREATRKAQPKTGADELLGFLRERGMRTALATNNSDENTRFLMDRFGLDFDLVLTRDSGVWKPSGAPLAEAARRLGVAPERCLAVGDSHYDVLAGREAGYGRICLLHATVEASREEVDLTFPDIRSFLRYLRLVL
jgi:HAD superfamily hydrolase (TIGR01509 family)